MAPKGQRFLTLATKNDWTPILSSLEATLSIKYVESGMFPTPNRLEFASFRDLPRFGEALRGDAIQEPEYLIMKREAPVYSRHVRVKTGENRYVSDHENNPESVIFCAGGVLEEPRAVIQGEVSKLSTSASAEEIFHALSKRIKKHFRAIKAYRVGSEALSLKPKGYRLTSSIRRPVEYDLSPDDARIDR
jgi:hypothetical protein